MKVIVVLLVLALASFASAQVHPEKDFDFQDGECHRSNRHCDWIVGHWSGFVTSHAASYTWFYNAYDSGIPFYNAPWAQQASDLYCTDRPYEIPYDCTFGYSEEDDALYQYCWFSPVTVSLCGDEYYGSSFGTPGYFMTNRIDSLQNGIHFHNLETELDGCLPYDIASEDLIVGNLWDGFSTISSCPDPADRTGGFSPVLPSSCVVSEFTHHTPAPSTTATVSTVTNPTTIVTPSSTTIGTPGSTTTGTGTGTTTTGTGTGTGSTTTGTGTGTGSTTTGTGTGTGSTTTGTGSTSTSTSTSTSIPSSTSTSTSSTSTSSTSSTSTSSTSSTSTSSTSTSSTSTSTSTSIPSTSTSTSTSSGSTSTSIPSTSTSTFSGSTSTSTSNTGSTGAVSTGAVTTTAAAATTGAATTAAAATTTLSIATTTTDDYGCSALSDGSEAVYGFKLARVRPASFPHNVVTKKNDDCTNEKHHQCPCERSSSSCNWLVGRWAGVLYAKGFNHDSTVVADPSDSSFLFPFPPVEENVRCQYSESATPFRCSYYFNEETGTLNSHCWYDESEVFPNIGESASTYAWEQWHEITSINLGFNIGETSSGQFGGSQGSCVPFDRFDSDTFIMQFPDGFSSNPSCGNSPDTVFQCSDGSFTIGNNNMFTLNYRVEDASWNDWDASSSLSPIIALTLLLVSLLAFF